MDRKTWAENIANKIHEKEKTVLRRVKGGIPYTALSGRWDDYSDRDICWWTNGFWAGLLWQLYGLSGDAEMKAAAEAVERKLDRNFTISNGMDHDSGFKWLLTAFADYKFTGSTESKNRVMLAANDLAGRFNPAGNFIRAWNDDGDGSKAGVAIIDCMMNLPLLYEATKLSRDPRFANAAKLHADTAMKHFIREDGSARHIVEFDPYGGEFLRAVGGQGYDENSAWTRGQGWALYGFTLSYLHTKKSEYLECAKRSADYFLANIPESGLIPIDFKSPNRDGEDSSAAAIAASGLYELYGITQDKRYCDGAVKLLVALDEKRCDYGEDADNIVSGCTVAYHGERNLPLVYADYFYTEAILKLCGKGTFLW